MWQKTHKIFFLVGIITSIIPNHLFAQNLGNSPYSQVGVGDLRFATFAHQQGMGAGVGNVPIFAINPLNPATLSRLSKTKNTVFEAGVIGNLKEIRQGDVTQRDFAGSLGYLLVAFPLSNKMGASVGLSPYSSVNYNYAFRQPVENSQFLADVNYRGSGGLNTVHFSTGYDFGKGARPDTLKHRFSVGLRVNYVFGSIIEESISKVRVGTNVIDDYKVAYYKRTRFDDFTFTPAVHYTYKIAKEKFFNVGLAYSIGSDLNAKRLITVDRRRDETLISADTLQRNERGKVNLPSQIKLGVNLEKAYKWSINADISYQNWSNYRNFERKDTLGVTWTASVGGHFIPDFTSVKKGFWRRTVYRGGFSYQQSPLSLRGVVLQDYALRMGVSIPLIKSNSLSMLNIAVVLGQNGANSNGLVLERYMQIHFGITINDRTWFLKPKFN